MYSADAIDADSDARNTLQCFSVGALAHTEDSSVTVFHLLDWKCSDLKHPCRTNSISRAFRGWFETFSSLFYCLFTFSSNVHFRSVVYPQSEKAKQP